MMTSQPRIYVIGFNRRDTNSFDQFFKKSWFEIEPLGRWPLGCGDGPQRRTGQACHGRIRGI